MNQFTWVRIPSVNPNVRVVQCIGRCGPNVEIRVGFPARAPVRAMVQGMRAQPSEG